MLLYGRKRSLVLKSRAMAILSLVAIFGLAGADCTRAAQIEEIVPPGPTDGTATRQPAGPEAPGYLGVIADDRGQSGRGVRLVDVLPGSPAAQAGLARGDLLTHVDGSAVRSISDFLAIMSRRPAGARLLFGVERTEGSDEITVTLAHRPPPGQRRFARFGRIASDPAIASTVDPATGARPQRLGVLVVPVSEDIRRRLQLPDHHGAVVTAVAKGSAADHAQLPIGATIVAVDHDPVDGPLDLARLISAADPGKSVILAYLVGERMYECEVTLREDHGQPAGAAGDNIVKPGTGATSPPDDVQRLKRRVRELEAIIRRLEKKIEGQGRP